MLCNSDFVILFIIQVQALQKLKSWAILWGRCFENLKLEGFEDLFECNIIFRFLYLYCKILIYSLQDGEKIKFRDD